MTYDAFDEYKRVDHLIHVTLKYTRTVDIIRNVIKRLISTFDLMFDEIIEWGLENNKIDAVPRVPLLRATKIKDIFKKDDEINKIIDFYLDLRKIYNSPYKKKEEYRKNVTLITKKEEINIETLKDYSEITKKYLNYLSQLIE